MSNPFLHGVAVCVYLAACSTLVFSEDMRGIPDSSWQQFEHHFRLESDNRTPYIEFVTEDAVRLEVRKRQGATRCGVGTWNELMNTLASDSNRIVRMSSTLCGTDLMLCLDTDEQQPTYAPSATSLCATVSWRTLRT